MRCRLLATAPLDGASNMALDEAILLLGGTTPTLRLYSWSSPCLSIGYSQEVGRDVDLDACRRLGIGLVRRPTGGGAILHEADMTYSLVAPETHPAVCGSVVDSYRKVSLGLMAGLAHLGLNPEMAPAISKPVASNAACFYHPSAYELTVDGRKLAGSAQCRRQGMMLQHGSVLLEMDPSRAVEVLKPPLGEDRLSWAEGFLKRAICLREALGKKVSFEEAARAVGGGFRESLGLDLDPGDLTPEELDLARLLREEKYANSAWNLAR